MRKTQPISVRLVWGRQNQRLTAGDKVRYKIPANGNGNGQIQTLEFEGRVISLPTGLINPLRYVPIVRDDEEIVSRCKVDIVPIESVISGPHSILTPLVRNRNKH
jgi:hypothetical protein